MQSDLLAFIAINHVQPHHSFLQMNQYVSNINRESKYPRRHCYKHIGTYIRHRLNTSAGRPGDCYSSDLTNYTNSRAFRENSKYTIYNPVKPLSPIYLWRSDELLKQHLPIPITQSRVDHVIP
jgi:hypothetical protein